MPPPQSFFGVLTGWLKIFARTWPNRPALEEEDFALYAEAMKDLDAATLNWACREAFKTCRFFPVPADILAHVRRDNATRIEIAAAEAWNKVLAYVSSVGANLQTGNGKLSEREMLAANNAGGLAYLESCPTEELQWRRKDFIAAYANYAALDDSRRPLTNAESQQALQAAIKRLRE
jgi:hypothetical protein